MHEIKQIGVFQAAKVMAIMSLVLSVVGFILVTIIVMVNGMGSGNIQFGGMLLRTLLSPILGFIFTAFLCLVYNLVASKIGGIEMELGVKEEPDRPSIISGTY